MMPETMSASRRRFGFPGILTAGAALAICAASTPARALELEIENGTPWPITALYLAPASSNDFRHNAMAADDGDPLEPDYTFTITDIGPGRYDLRLVMRPDSDCIVRNIEIGQSRAIVVAENGSGNCIELPHPALQVQPAE